MRPSTDPVLLPLQMRGAELKRLQLLCRALLRELPGSSALMFDRELFVTLAEGPFLEARGLRTDLVGGRPLEAVLAKPIWAQVADHYRAVLEGEPRSFDLHGRDGTTIRVSAVPVVNDGVVVGGLAIAADETGRRMDRAELERRLAQQSAVARLGELAAERAPVDTLMQTACTLVATALDVPLVSLYEHAGNGEMLVRAGVGWPAGTIGSRFQMRSYRDPGARERYADGPVVIEDLPNQPEWRARNLRDAGVVSSASVIVGNRHAPLGLLGAHTLERREFSSYDLDFLRSMGHVVGGALAQRAAEERIRHDALHDALTGLPNRRLLTDRLTSAFGRALRAGTQLAVMCVDVDRLKVVNDTLGHAAGDELLQRVAERLRELVRPADTVARFAGDGFTVVVDDVADGAHADGIADRIVRAFDEPLTIAGAPRHVSVSVGLVLAGPGSGRDPEQLVADSEAAMYHAKHRGRGRHERLDPALRDETRARRRLEDDLRRALEEDGSQLWIAYQPIHAIADRKLVSVEALVRWRHPERGPVGPDRFIPVAEESDLVVALGARVLREACGQVARWRGDTPAEDLAVSVNVSARQVAAPGLVETVAEVLRSTGLPPHALGLEITEGLLLEHSPATAQILSDLQALGVRLVLDDFGTGYSSLAYLRRYPLDGLKIDRAFVGDLGHDGRSDGAIVQAIVGMARALGLRTIPEGVETEGQLHRLAELGCDYAQGFLLGRPLAAAELEALLRAGRRPR